ncbi:hypothetical protein BDZ89DRAFT_1061077 [Hymenopellis radicata]|nr:hypothetical protein BDZ89DRAFT_1061077 [Hymenopellis radicata]
MSDNALPSTCTSSVTDLRNVVACPVEMLDTVSDASLNVGSNRADAQSVLPPIHSVSNEILHEIFIYCVPSRSTSSEILADTDSLNAHVAPWTLIRVCHGWRELVISSPLLWTFFALDTDSHPQNISPQQCAQRTCLYLERSRSLSLSILIVDPMGRMPNHPVLPVLRHAMSRCTRLTTDSSTVFLQALSGTVFSSLSLLEVNSVSFSYRQVHVDTFNTVSAPKLQTVFCLDPRWQSMKLVSIPWSQVTMVYTLPIFDDVDLQWLREIPHVTELGVTLLRSSFIPPGTVISLPELDEFTLTEDVGAGSGYLKEFMSALVLDALSFLRLRYLASTRLLFPSLTAGLAERLKRLAIKCTTHGHSDNIRNLLEFISHCSQLTDLALADNPLEAAFVTGLRYSSMSPILPHLRFLDISLCLNPPNDVTPLLDMLESRCPNVSEDASVSMIPPADEQDGCLDSLCVPPWLYFQKDSRWEAIKVRKNVYVELR